jgi:hypothetical protein
MSIYYHLLQENYDRLLQEATAYSILIELGSLQVELPALTLTITPKDLSVRHYWTQEKISPSLWIKEN